jgi:hypothetical protein
MTRRHLTTVSWLLLLAITVGGSTNCGWIWQDWIDPAQKSCLSDRQPAQP